MNMGQARKRTLVRCKSCGKEWLKNAYAINRWSGLCKSCAYRGRRLSPEHRAKLVGRPFSKETRMKMSAAKKGKPIASWITEKAHIAWRGQHHTEDWKRVQAEKKKGSRNPNWNNGSSLEPYGLSFDEQLREAIRERDNRACRICGEKENGRRLAIHHIDYNKNNDECTNLLSLCAPCHAATNQKRKYWQAKFSSEINNVL
jgi:ribosomal protein L37E